MTTETFIPGKAATLETSIAAMQSQLAKRGFKLTASSALHPADGIWSVHMQDQDCPLLFSNGHGASELAASASAYGEFFERLGTHYFWTHYYLGADRAGALQVHYPQEQWFASAGDGAWPKQILTPELHAFYNPDGDIGSSVLVDRNSGNAARGICALPYQRLRDGSTVYIPVNIVGNLYASNGMAAGNSVDEARAQAMSEIVERAIKYRIVAEGLCLPDVPDDVIARYPAIQAGIAGLRKAGFGILVKDASLGGKYPVMNVTLIHPRDQGICASFGAHPRLEVALERAMTELLQGRPLDTLEGFPEPVFDTGEIDEAANLEQHYAASSGAISWSFLSDTPDYPFVDWNFSSSTGQDCQWLVDVLHAEGKDIYVADFSEQGVYSCSMLVPGFSEIYPVEDLEWENNSAGNALRPLMVRLQELSVQECTSLLAELQTSNLQDGRALWQVIGLAVPQDTPWQQLRIGELKTLLALVVGDQEAVLEGCEWIHHFSDLPKPRRLVFRCIESIIHLDDEDEAQNYTLALKLLYGEDTLRQAEALLDGSERFFGLDSLGPNFEASALHQSLLAAYDKLFAPGAA